MSEPQDLTMIGADDALLDLLGAGGEPPEGDEVGAMLATWRTEIEAGPPAIRRAAPGLRSATTPHRSRAPRRPLTPRTRLLLGAAAAVVVLAGTAAVMAGDARPGSPLWPITRVLYADWADSVVAEQEAQQALDQAQAAIDGSEYVDAIRLLDEAERLVDAVRDTTVAQRLRERIATLRGLIPGLLPPSTPTPPPQGSTGGTAPTTPAPGVVLPTGILPTGILPTGVLPSCITLPPVLPGVLPSCLLP